MVPFNIAFIGPNDPPPWKGDYIDCGVLEDVNVLEGGMETGLPSLAFRMKLPAAETGLPVEIYAVAQQTARNIVTLAKAIMGKYPTLMMDNPDSKTTDIVKLLNDLTARELDVYVLTREQMMQLLARVKP